MTQSTLSHQVVADDIKYDIITNSPINLSALLALSHHAQAGAVVLFSGETRNNNIGKIVLYLEFEAYVSLANNLISNILETATEKWNLNFALCQHRIGKVDICESAVCVITTSTHRAEAYQANQYIMHRVKHEVPIWKKEYYEDGSFAWGNNCNCVDPNNHDIIEF